MKDCGQREPLVSETSKALPRHPARLAAAIEQPQPAFADFKPKARETGKVSRDCMIVEVALNYAPQPLPDFCQRLMHSLPQFVLHLSQLGEESLADGLA